MRGSIGSLLFVLSLSSAGVVDGTEHWADLLDYDIGLAMGGIEGAVSSSNDCILVTYNRNYSTNDGQTIFLAMNLAGNLADSFEWDPPYVACYFADHSFWMTIENCKLMSDGVNAGWDQNTFSLFLIDRLLIQPGYAEIDADSQLNLSVSASPSASVTCSAGSQLKEIVHSEYEYVTHVLAQCNYSDGQGWYDDDCLQYYSFWMDGLIAECYGDVSAAIGYYGNASGIHRGVVDYYEVLLPLGRALLKDGQTAQAHQTLETYIQRAQSDLRGNVFGYTDDIMQALEASIADAEWLLALPASESLSTDEMVSTISGTVTTTLIVTSEGPIDGMLFANIPSGSFSMGSPLSSVEEPVRNVSVQSFELMTTEVTQKMWEEVIGSNPASVYGGGEYGVGSSYPVYTVSWNECQQFIARLNEIDPDFVYRLPSEAEWEYACRAGTTTAYYWGNSFDEDYCWYSGDKDLEVHPVGQKLPNAWGLYDMSGNVWEWCGDYYHDNYSGAPTDGSEWLKPASSYRVLRGASVCSVAPYCRSAMRWGLDPSWNNIDWIGLRVARTAR